MSIKKGLRKKRVGIVFGSFAPLHQGHLDIIMQAKKENDGGCIVIVCGFPNDKGEHVDLPYELRYQYVRKIFQDDDLIKVYGINDEEEGILAYPDGWEKWLDVFHHKIWSKANDDENAEMYFYVGEEEYFNGLKKRGYHSIFINRNENLISGTLIRNNPIKYWHKIAHTFRSSFSKNILVTGTASEGKSTLVKDIANYFNAPFAHEWARDYMEENALNENNLKLEDYLIFLSGQQNLINEKINSKANNGFIIADTDALVTKMYATYYAGDSNFTITNSEADTIASVADLYAAKIKWDKIFVLAPHGEFIDDGVRFMGHSNIETRMELFQLLMNELRKMGLMHKVVILNGNYYENYLSVLNYIKNEVLHEN